MVADAGDGKRSSLVHPLGPWRGTATVAELSLRPAAWTG
jgi:hypothetical protein